jgi:hypothetical protein
MIIEWEYPGVAIRETSVLNYDMHTLLSLPVTFEYPPSRKQIMAHNILPWGIQWIPKGRLQ